MIEAKFLRYLDGRRAAADQPLDLDPVRIPASMTTASRLTFSARHQDLKKGLRRQPLRERRPALPVPEQFTARRDGPWRAVSGGC
jgi:hypothetical protein